MSKCKHCEFLDKTFGEILKQKDSTNREYWLFTEVFVYLHGSDECNEKKITVKPAKEIMRILGFD